MVIIPENKQECTIGHKQPAYYCDECLEEERKKERKRILELIDSCGQMSVKADSVRKYAHNNKNKIRERTKKVYHKYKSKALARAKTRNHNEKTGICFNCQKRTKTEFHHISYKPNLFTEVCKECHNKIHGRNYYDR